MNNKVIYLLTAVVILACFPLYSQSTGNIDLKLSEPPGIYSADVVLTLFEGTRDIFYRFTESSQTTPVPYQFPLKLTALKGEERLYSLKFFISGPGGLEPAGDGRWVIDKKSPVKPEVDLISGRYTGSRVLNFNEGTDPLFYTLDGDLSASVRKWDGAPVELEPRTQPYHVLAYRKDSAGNVSSMGSWEYTVESVSSISPNSFSIESPVSGDFINPQFLYITRSGDHRIFYTLDGGNPLGAGGLEYTEGLTIPERGKVTLKVASRSSDGTGSAVQTVQYSVSGGREIPSVVSSGVFDRQISFGFDTEALHYTFEERMPVITDLNGASSVTLYPLKGSLVFYSLRCRLMEQGKLSTGQYRYFYAVDTRVPVEPLISIEGTAPFSKSPTVTLSAPDYASIRYTLDGSEPDENSSLYVKPFVPAINAGTGVLPVKAAAYSTNGRRGGTAERLIPYDFQKPDAPVINSSTVNESAVFSLTLPEDTVAIYEVALLPDFPAEPGPLSPEWHGEEIQIPWGMSCDGKIRFASRDRAGNVSSWVEASFSLDRTPPAEPRISFTDGKAVIEGEGKIYYTLAASGDNSLEDPVFTEYTLPVAVSTRIGLMSQYRVSAFTEDSAGNRSTVVHGVIFLDDRLPVVPAIRGVEDRRVYTLPVIRPSYAVQDRDFEIRYTLGTNDQIPPDPTRNSPLLNDCIIETPEGQENYYHLKLLPIFPERGRTGKTVSYRFSVDRKLPGIPEVKGLPDGNISKDKLEISLNGIGEDETVYYLIGRRNKGSETALLTPADPVAAGEVYTTPLVLEPSEGEDIEYSLSLAVMDKAGNRNEPSRPYIFRIDRKPPALPFLDGVPVSGVSSNPLNVEIITTDEVKAQYRLISEKNLSSKALTPFSDYTVPVPLEGSDNLTTVYQFEYRSIDAAGNYSNETGVTTITVDRRTIPQPQAPAVINVDPDGRALLSWPWNSRGQIYFRLGGKGDFVQYVSPISLTINDDEDGIIQYYLEQKSGIRSALHSMDIRSVDESSAGQLFSGVENGKTYAGEISVTPAVVDSANVIRYEIGYRGKSPELKQMSPVFNDTLLFNVPFGAEKEFEVLFGLFSDRNSGIPVKTESLTFWIDKEPPVPPVLTEIINPDIDSRFKLIELESRGDKIKYTLAQNGLEAGPYNYEGVLSLDTRGKAGETVEISAWSVDIVGNESRKEKWSVLLDQDIVYVAATGNDLYEGTRLRPFRSIEKALISAGAQKKTTLYMSAGSYEINRPVEVGGAITIFGGLDEKTWEKTGISLIGTGRYFPLNTPLFTLKGTAEIRDLRFISNSPIVAPLKSENGDLTLSNVDIVEGAPFKYLLQQERGSTHQIDSKLSCGGTSGYFSISRGNLTVENSEITGSGSGEVSLLNLDGGSLQIVHSTISPSAGERTTAVTARNAYVTVNDSTLYSGSGRRKAAVFSTTGGELTVRNSTIVNEAGARTSVAFEAAGGALSLEKSDVVLSAQSGTTGFLLKKVQMNVEYCNIRSGNRPGFVFLLQQEAGAVDLENTTVSLTAAGEPVVADIKGGRLTLNHDSILISTDRRKPAGILSSDGTQLFVSNTILSNTGSKSGTALSGDASTSWSVRNSNFGNWSKVALYGGEECISVEDLDLLDADPFGGWLNGNIEEDPQQTFGDRPFALKESSACIDAGIITGPVSLDMDGQKRPNPKHGIRPFYDIGADEFYAVSE